MDKKTEDSFGAHTVQSQFVECSNKHYLQFMPTLNIWIQWNFDIAMLHLIKPIVLERSRVQLLEFRVTNDSNLDPHVSSGQGYKAMPNDWMNWRFKQDQFDRNSRSVWGMNNNLYRKFHPDVILVELNKSEQVATKLQLQCSWSM